MQFMRNIGKKVLPERFIEWYRRRRQVRAYLKALGYELHERATSLANEDIEGRIAARHDGFYQRAVKEILDRTELVLQGLDRRIEGTSTRHGNELRSLRAEVEELRRSTEALRAELDARGRAPAQTPEATPASSVRSD